MALPKINSNLTYDTTVPSTKEKIKYRPFLVGEEKLFLIATQSDSPRVLYDTVKRVVSQCVLTENFDVDTLTEFDLEYIFILLRSKSVGEKEDLLIACESCEERNTVTIDFEKSAYIRNLNQQLDNRIDFGRGISVTLKGFDASKALDLAESEMSEVDQVFHVIDSMIDRVYTEEEVMVFADESYDERYAFIDSMTAVQLQKIQKYIQSLPKVAMDISFVCGNCGTHNKRVLEGISSFFT